MRLDGSSVLVTGATGGIGTAIARELAARSCSVVVTGRRQALLDGLVTELGPPARGFAADLANLDEMHTLLVDAGPLDVLVANAGVDIREDLAEVGEAQLQDAIRINLTVPAALARAAIRPMIERGKGHIVFMSSVAGLVATPGNGPVYTASKWGLRGLGLALRQELYGTGVGVSTVFPGPIRGAGMFARTGAALPWYAGSSSPEDVAKAVAKAIERNRAEVTVASGMVRLSAAVGVLAPVLVGTLSRRAGADTVRKAMIAATGSR